MKTSSWGASMIVRMLGIGLLLIGSTLPGSAQEKNKAQSATNQAEPTAHSADRTGGPQESIKVHGHWTIVIRNEDGSVASRHEFNNSLNEGSFLSLLLSREASVAANSYGIVLNVRPDRTFGDLICRGVSSSGDIIASVCTILEGAGTNTDDRFRGLTVTAVNGALRLAGSAKASYPGRISFVATFLCYSVSGQGGCFPVTFTARDLTLPEPPSTAPPPAINVVAGQTIDVTVTISFL